MERPQHIIRKEAFYAFYKHLSIYILIQLSCKKGQSPLNYTVLYNSSPSPERIHTPGSITVECQYHMPCQDILFGVLIQKPDIIVQKKEKQ